MTECKPDLYEILPIVSAYGFRCEIAGRYFIDSLEPAS